MFIKHEFVLCSIIGSIDGVVDISGAHISETLLHSPQSSTNNLDTIVNNDIGKYLIESVIYLIIFVCMSNIFFILL